MIQVKLDELIRYTTAALFTLLVSACFNGPLQTFGEIGASQDEDEGGNRIVGTETNKEGVETARVAPNDSETQVVSSQVGGAQISFPPGALSVPTNIAIESAVDIAGENNLAELNVSTEIESTGPSVAVRSDSSKDATQPFTIAINPPAGLNLFLAQDPDEMRKRIVVMYHVEIAETNSFELGIIPPSKVELIDGKVHFETKYFGVFQAVSLKDPPQNAVKQSVAERAKTQREIKDLPPIEILSREPFVVRPGETVTLTGKNFRPTMRLAIAGKVIKNLEVQSDSLAQFATKKEDENDGDKKKIQKPGKKTVTAEQDGVTQKLTLFLAEGDTDIPVITLDPEEVCQGIQYYDKNGFLREGERDCQSQELVENCSEERRIDCKTSDRFPAMIADYDLNDLGTKTISELTAENPNFVFWNKGGEPFQISGLSNLKAENIKKGVHISGVTGAYPSAYYPIDGSDINTKDLTAQNYTDLIKSDDTFEFFSSDGNRFTKKGDEDLKAENIKNGVEILGITGNAAQQVIEVPSLCADVDQSICEQNSECRWNGEGDEGICELNPWNIRAGISINGQEGKIKTNCRNLSISDGMSETIDNYNDKSDFLPVGLPEDWTPYNKCREEIWLDASKVEVEGIFKDKTCTEAGVDCIMKDQITGLMWSEMHGKRKWKDARDLCSDSNHGGYEDWRLPTQMELMSAYNHGMRELIYKNDNGYGDTRRNNKNFGSIGKLWSSTKNSSSHDNYWVINISKGEVDDDDHDDNNEVICVRK